MSGELESKIEAAEAAIERLRAHLEACDALVQRDGVPLYARPPALRVQRDAILALKAAEDDLAALRAQSPRRTSIVDELRARRVQRMSQSSSE